jgi:hypothetical protein
MEKLGYITSRLHYFFTSSMCAKKAKIFDRWGSSICGKLGDVIRWSRIIGWAIFQPFGSGSSGLCPKSFSSRAGILQRAMDVTKTLFFKFDIPA